MPHPANMNGIRAFPSRMATKAGPYCNPEEAERDTGSPGAKVASFTFCAKFGADYVSRFRHYPCRSIQSSRSAQSDEKPLHSKEFIVRSLRYTAGHPRPALPLRGRRVRARVLNTKPRIPAPARLRLCTGTKRDCGMFRQRFH